MRVGCAPLERPTDSPVLRVVSGEAVLIENQNLFFAEDGCGECRAVTGATAAAEPDRFAGIGGVGDKGFAVFAASAHDHFALMNQRSTAESPFLAFVAGLGCTGLIAWPIGGQASVDRDVALPNLTARLKVEAAQDSLSTQGVDLVFKNGRRCPRAFAGNGGVVVAGVFGEPKHLAGLDVITNGGLVFLSLLLSDGTMPGDGEAGPRRADGLTPKFGRRVGAPICGQLGAGHFAVPAWPKKLRE